MSRPVKLAPLQTSLRHVRRAAHNADFFGLRISKIPANALKMKYFAELVAGRGSFALIAGAGKFYMGGFLWLG